jgi:hypothetical protein
VAENLVPVTQVALDGDHARVVPVPASGERHGEGVQIDAQDPRPGYVLVGDVMNVADARDTAPEVDELPDPGVETAPHRAEEEGAMGSDDEREGG